MTPKSLLRHPKCRSDWKELQPPHRFMRVIPNDNDPLKGPEQPQVRKVIFCSGKIYYELVEQRESMQTSGIAVIRLEQLAPFPFQEVVVVFFT